MNESLLIFSAVVSGYMLLIVIMCLIYIISVFLPLHCFWITKYFHVKAIDGAQLSCTLFALLKCIRNAFFNKSERIVLSMTDCCLSLNRQVVLKIVTKKVLTDEFIIVQWYDPDWVIRFLFFPLNNQQCDEKSFIRLEISFLLNLILFIKFHICYCWPKWF